MPATKIILKYGGRYRTQTCDPLRVKRVSEESLFYRHSDSIQIGKPPLNLAKPGVGL